MVFNFGLFDFDTPNFYGKFVKGNLQYFLGIQHTRPFIDLYVQEGRRVEEQILHLSPLESQMIYSRLLFLYRPENRYYRYGFMEKNCTTALRDLIFALTELDFENTVLDTTWRKMFNHYLQNRLWLRLGVNLILGKKVDTQITRFQSFFLPDYLHDGLAAIRKTDGEALVSSETVYHPAVAAQKSYPLWKHPVLWTSLILLAALFFRRRRGWQAGVFAAAALSGLFILTVSLVSEHPEVRNNLNVLWCNPLYLPAFWFAIRKKQKALLYTARLIAGFTLAAVIVWLSGLQAPDPAFFPLIAALTVTLGPYLRPAPSRAIRKKRSR